MYLFGGAYLVPLGNYLLLFIYAVYVVFSFFCFSVFCFFFPVARTNSVNVVDQKQSVLDATAIGNFFLHKHLLLFIYAVYVVFSSFRFLFFFSPAARTNLANVVDQKQSFLDATAIGNFSLHKH